MLACLCPPQPSPLVVCPHAPHSATSLNPFANWPWLVVPTRRNLIGQQAPPFDCSKARTELGMEFIPIKQAMKDQVDAMLEKKLIKA
eukprot:74891-Chlamydomonas_euryale.AAC.4